MKNLDQIISLCKLIDIRKDYNQSNGGNISFKDGNKIYIKPSGKHMARINGLDDFYCSQMKIFSDLLTKTEDLDLHQQKFFKQFSPEKHRPSIETFLHVQLKKYTLHLHHIGSLIISCRRDWKEFVAANFQDALCLDYAHPGIELGKELQDQIKSLGFIPEVVFMQNHGIILSSDNYDDFKLLINITFKKINSLIEYHNFNIDYFEKAESLFNILHNRGISFYSSLYNKKIPENFSNFLSPDIIIHLGETTETKDLITVGDKKVLIFKDYIFILEQDPIKRLEIEELVLAQIEICQNLKKSEIHFLSSDIVKRISTWALGKARR